MHLGTGMGRIVNLLNPEAIFLGGEVPRVAKNFILKPLFHFLPRTDFPPLGGKFEGDRCTAGRRGGRVGGSCRGGGKASPGLSLI